LRNVIALFMHHTMAPGSPRVIGRAADLVWPASRAAASARSPQGGCVRNFHRS
jgi:hypothetical protein